MKYKASREGYLLRIDPDEEITEVLIKFATKLNIKAGVISGIGAVKKFEIGHYNVATQTYNSKTFEGQYEIVSLQGNLTAMDNKPYVHLHMIASDENYQCVGGHLNHATISATGEIFLAVKDMEVERYLEPSVGLNWLKIK